MPRKPRVIPDNWISRLATREGVPDNVMFRRLRENLGYTVRDVARHCGVSHNAVWYWEIGRKYPDAYSHERMLELFEEIRPPDDDGPDPPPATRATASEPAT